ncbi:hypothetical protein JANAI62_24370 [Jannaschia pagri]|uniref:Periplasmic chaperone for outer membrane proteins Skp n=1 Tax=Jannaschia pagri TaxID=2829797 RepID=A0ABQ4NN34_9RHOB|nr:MULTISPECIES: OmpH family outer membrane protein [unclassified Jannaschia]GIT91980.1 hypothetical protein JANAI61_24380 [Jannaschia sp. AI_61]GIT95814.1 hypothetical protein JANAI62_24370 [Jannaschia sp. AI_62]
MRGLCAALLVLGLGSGALAQGTGGAAPLSPGIAQTAVAVLDRDALFSQSLFGQRVADDLEAASTELAAENRRIEAELEAEEQSLTRQRASLDMDAFRVLAADFDARVVAIRRAQDAKSRAIQQQSDRAQSVFFERANPILVALARETGALVILDRRIVIASADQVDITALALERVNEALGSGSTLGTTPPTQRPAQDAPAPQTPPTE